MKWQDAFIMAGHVLNARIFHVRHPLAIHWALTYRCNQKCAYCGIPDTPISELPARQVCDMIDSFARLGTRWIAFSGGEPLLRQDLPLIVQHAKSRKIYVTVSTNGALLPERIHDLVHADRIKLSLDGPEEIHDQTRGKGSYKKVIKAIHLCLANNIRVAVDCVLSRYNLAVADDVIAICQKNKIKVSFQPATAWDVHFETPASFLPPVDKYRATIKHLISIKKRGGAIRNSVAGLQHLLSWPSPKDIPCYMCLLSFNVEPSGIISPCINKPYIPTLEEAAGQWGHTSQEIINKMRLPLSYGECWGAAIVEWSLITSLNGNAILNYLRNGY
ncbi:MAG TPA: radical SAM protein [Candidatus Omnitrophota bacterium]|nr:radical SAM protein [Candidatus Omnitrophota bacterium]HQO58527.1 radical SAM protein [Candidatus Omnitrophota bacterium]